MHVELVVAKLVTMALGFLVAYKAYQGYRQFDSEPMLYLAAGFFLISFGAVIEGFIFEFLIRDLTVAGTIQTAVVALGMVVVLYSLYGSLDGASSAERVVAEEED